MPHHQIRDGDLPSIPARSKVHRGDGPQVSGVVGEIEREKFPIDAFESGTATFQLYSDPPQARMNNGNADALSRAGGEECAVAKKISLLQKKEDGVRWSGNEQSRVHWEISQCMQLVTKTDPE